MEQGTQASNRPRALVLGAYGLIGSACLRALEHAGYDVTGVGRDHATARMIAPDIDWLICDLTTQTASDWARHLAGVDVIVNASGALQGGLRDNLKAIHQDVIHTLIEGLGSQPTRFIQISAAGAAVDASTAFMSTKAQGDAALMDSTLDWIILRPTLVLGRAAYGGTALLRAAAAMPLVGVRVLPDAPIQTVALDDLSAAVVQAAKGKIPSCTCADLTAAEVHRFEDLTARMRRWLGFEPWRATFTLPSLLLSATSKIADALGSLGWRSPMRSTALTVLQGGIKGDPAIWEKAGGAPCRSFEQTLRDMPATVQDRWFARLFLLLPIAIATLSVFWLLSGIIGLIWSATAIEVLTSRSISNALAVFAVYVGGLLDIALGIAILFRRHARAACAGMIALSTAYLVSGTLLTPDIWADPLGPFVKVLPGMTLAAITAVLLDDR